MATVFIGIDVARDELVIAVRPAAAKIAGAPNRKPNRAAAARESPNDMPTTIVAPDRETPGTNAIAWAMPITSAAGHVKARASPVPRAIRSTTRNATAPSDNVMTVTPGERSDRSITSSNARPTTAMGRVPRAINCACRPASLGEVDRTDGSDPAMAIRSLRKNTTIAKSVPRWQATSNASPNGPMSHPRKSRANNRWAELETGRNSVSP